MVLRVGALLKRAQINHERRVIVGHTKLEYDSLTVTQNDKEEMLPQKEFLILFKLLSSLNHIFTRQQLMDEIWDWIQKQNPAPSTYILADCGKNSATIRILKL